MQNVIVKVYGPVATTTVEYLSLTTAIADIRILQAQGIYSRLVMNGSAYSQLLDQ